jgi:hypothetical protein
MGTSTPTTSISERVRHALDAGKSREEVILGLVATGLSRPTAERFVDRALSEPWGPSGSDAKALEPSEVVEDPGGRRALVSGAFWFSLGGTVTGATYLVASPGEEFVVAYGAVLAGLVALGRGVLRFRGTSQPFPWLAVLLAAAAPPTLTFALVGTISGYRYGRNESRRAGEARRLELAQAAQEDARAAAERKTADAERAQQHEKRIARAREQLQNASSPMTRCEAALDLGHAGAREAIPELIQVLNRVTESVSVRSCAAGALLKLGETELPLAFYLDCARAGTSERFRIGVAGFKDVGPRAADVALPYLREALASPHWDMRHLAVETLSSLGPKAEPLLREATRDSNEEVRKHALRALGE